MLLKLKVGGTYGGTYVDATVGLGGHSEEMLRHIGSGKLLCIDRDEESMKMAMQRLSDKRAVFIKGSFSNIKNLTREAGVDSVDGILFDLGTSMFHLRTPERGFSFLSKEMLDMRMDKNQPLTAKEIVNEYSEKEIGKILFEYGEERLARKIAKAITLDRQKKEINTCDELAELVSRVYRYRGKTHPATRTFQALRIAVNDEMNELKNGLASATDVLKSGGRLCVIAYHSLEDRIVKNFIRDGGKQGVFRVITKKPLAPSMEEIRLNPSARSAKLRGAEKV